MALRIRYTVRLISAFLNRFKGIIGISFFLGLVIFLSANIFIPKIFGRSVKKIGVAGRYYTDNLPKNILKKISLGLTKVGDMGELEPGIASSWETPDKGKTWIFHLNGDLYWQDGKKVVSKDIKYDYSDVTIETPDEKTIIFKLKDEFAPFPYIVDKAVFKKGLLGVGDWKVEKITATGGILQSISIINKDLDKIIYKFYPTEDRTKLAMKLGQINIIEEIYDPEPLNKWKILNSKESVNTNQIVTLFFNTKDPTLSDKSLRQALSYAINKEAYLENRAISPISPSSWAYNSQVKPYNYNLDKAKEVIKDLPKEIKDNLTVNIVTTPSLLNIADSISKNWHEVGVKSEVQVSSLIPQDYQCFLAILDIPHDPDQYSIWHSTQTQSNLSKYQNPRIDKLLEDGRIELNTEERKVIYLDFQRFLLEDAPAVFLYHPVVYSIERK